MKPRHQRLAAVAVIGLGLVVAGGFLLRAFSANMMYFETPASLLARPATMGNEARLGGIVKPGSVKHEEDRLTLDFVVTDRQAEIPVRYTGLVPDLFRENQAVVVEGRLEGDPGGGRVFRATMLLARHDENYMPKELATALAKQDAVPDAMPRAAWQRFTPNVADKGTDKGAAPQEAKP